MNGHSTVQTMVIVHSHVSGAAADGHAREQLDPDTHPVVGMRLAATI